MNPRLLSRVALVVVGIPGLVNAVWILLASRSFYDDFPGIGNPWVSPDGPFNEHLLRDYGASLLGLVVLAICAFVWLNRPLVIASGLAWFAASVPHLAYHALNLDPYSSDDKVGIIAGLAVSSIAAAILVGAGLRLTGAGDTGRGIMRSSPAPTSSRSTT